MHLEKNEQRSWSEVPPAVLGTSLILIGVGVGAVGYKSVLGLNQLIIDSVKANVSNSDQLVSGWLDLAFSLSACIATGATLLALAGLMAFKHEIVWRVRVKSRSPQPAVPEVEKPAP